MSNASKNRVNPNRRNAGKGKERNMWFTVKGITVIIYTHTFLLTPKLHAVVH